MMMEEQRKRRRTEGQHFHLSFTYKHLLYAFSSACYALAVKRFNIPDLSFVFRTRQKSWRIDLLDYTFHFAGFNNKMIRQQVINLNCNIVSCVPCLKQTLPPPLVGSVSE